MSCPKKISDESGLAFNSALNIFSVPPTNVSVCKSFFREVLPLSTITQESPYLFRMFSDNLWTDLSRVYLHLELSIQKLNEANWIAITAADDPEIGAIQSIGQTFIQQLKVEAGNMELYDSGPLYPYKAYLTQELSFSASVKAHFMAAGGYHRTKKHNDRTDSDFLARCKAFANGGKAQLLSRLDFDLGNQEL